MLVDEEALLGDVSYDIIIAMSHRDFYERPLQYHRPTQLIYLKNEQKATMSHRDFYKRPLQYHRPTQLIYLKN